MAPHRRSPSSTACAPSLESLEGESSETLNVVPINDQSVFVRAAIKGVALEGAIAAALTSVMILLFLGSWRSTVIIAVSIPLSILGLDHRLGRLGETLNLMTLGGLALAVGILVDDATVTIENINWHLEQGKPSRPRSSMARSRSSRRPRIAAVHLHRVHPDVLPRGRFRASCSCRWPGGDLCDGLLIHPVAYAGADDGKLPAARACRTRAPPSAAGTRNPLVRFQRRFEARFERVRYRLQRRAGSAPYARKGS
jgi:hypothetical protein